MLNIYIHRLGNKNWQEICNDSTHISIPFLQFLMGRNGLCLCPSPWNGIIFPSAPCGPINLSQVDPFVYTSDIDYLLTLRCFSLLSTYSCLLLLFHYRSRGPCLSLHCFQTMLCMCLFLPAACLFPSILLCHRCSSLPL